MNLFLPAVEFSYYRNIRCMRRPYRKIKSIGIEYTQKMTAEFFIGMVQMTILELLYVIICEE